MFLAHFRPPPMCNFGDAVTRNVTFSIFQKHVILPSKNISKRENIVKKLAKNVT